MTLWNIRRYVNAVLLPAAVILWCDPDWTMPPPEPTPAAIVEPDDRIEPTSRGGERGVVDLGEWSISAYCLRGTMRDGEWTHEGAVAVDPRYVELGTDLYIDGLDGIFTSHDTGSAVLGKHVDMWLPSCQAAWEWGLRTRKVWLVEE
jgi:3D (Asp-Asp-Asp) domain-containing protein